MNLAVQIDGILKRRKSVPRPLSMKRLYMKRGKIPFFRRLLNCTRSDGKEGFVFIPTKSG
jgi:hypothetical protein